MEKQKNGNCEGMAKSQVAWWSLTYTYNEEKKIVWLYI